MKHSGSDVNRREHWKKPESCARTLTATTACKMLGTTDSRPSEHRSIGEKVMSRIPKYADEAVFPQPPRMPLSMNEAREAILPAQWGLTKREYIATQIMAQLMHQEGHIGSHARSAVQAADALLEILSHG